MSTDSESEDDLDGSDIDTVDFGPCSNDTVSVAADGSEDAEERNKSASDLSGTRCSVH